jgi:hypothetical protein
MLEQVHENFHITILGENITPVAVAKDLGIILDSCLSYDEHIASVVSSCIAGLGQISRIKHIFDRKTLILIINSLIFSKMCYCSAVWSNTSQRNIEKLQAVQNFAARIVTGTRKYDHVTHVLQQLDWLPVKYMLKLREAIFAFKCLKGLAPSYLREKVHVRSDVHDVNTRQKNILEIPMYRLAASQRTFCVFVEFSASVSKNIDSLTHFKVEFYWKI